jgi:hypothetical protein
MCPSLREKLIDGEEQENVISEHYIMGEYKI